MEISFTISVTENDWDKTTGGWRVPALEIPGAHVEDIYADGNKIDPRDFNVDSRLKLIRWHQPNDRPRRVAIVVIPKDELAKASLTKKWQYFAILLPPAAAILAAIIASTGLTQKLSESEAEKNELKSIFDNQINIITSANERLRTENYNFHQKEELVGMPTTGWINGLIKKANGDPAVNAIISVRGGNQVLSLPNGEFLLEVKEGDTVQISYGGAILDELIIDETMLGKYINRMLPTHE